MKWHFYPAARFAEFAPRWRALHERGQASPMLDADFMAALLAAFSGGAQLLGCCEHDGDTVAMALLEKSGKGVWRSFQPAQAPLGPWLTRPGLDLDALLAALVRDLPGCALLAGISQLDPMIDARPHDTGSVNTLDYIQTARITMTGGFDAYWAARGKNLRSNLKKQRARLEREGIVTRMEVVRAEHDMAQAVLDYAALESAGWKGRDATAVRAGDAQARFYTLLLETFARRGAATVYRYRFGQQIVAMDLCVEGVACIVVLKTAYDESVPGHFSPALLMREEACRALFDEARLQRIEFYGRVMEWHLRWTDEVRCLYHLNYYRWPVLQRLHALARPQPTLE